MVSHVQPTAHQEQAHNSLRGVVKNLLEGIISSNPILLQQLVNENDLFAEVVRVLVWRLSRVVGG